jgi:hypothetical protein
VPGRGCGSWWHSTVCWRARRLVGAFLFCVASSVPASHAGGGECVSTRAYWWVRKIVDMHEYRSDAPKHPTCVSGSVMRLGPFITPHPISSHLKTCDRACALLVPCSKSQCLVHTALSNASGLPAVQEASVQMHDVALVIQLFISMRFTPSTQTSSIDDGISSNMTASCCMFLQLQHTLGETHCRFLA